MQDSLRQGPKGETLQQAFTRYRDFAMASDIDLAEEVGFGCADDEVTVDRLEKLIDSPLPADLRAFYLQHGSYSMSESGDDWETIHLSCADDLVCDLQDDDPLPGLGVVEFIDWFWGGRPEFAERFSREQIAELNRNYHIFGHCYVHDNRHRYYYFDRAGKMGVIDFNQDAFESACEHDFEPMLQASPAHFDLDGLISSEIDAMIARSEM